MIKMMILSIVLLSSTNIWGQFRHSNDIILCAYELYESGEFKDAAITFDSAFANGVNNHSYYYDAAEFWVMAQNNDNAIERLKSCAINGFHDKEKLELSSIYKPLHNHHKWLDILRQVEKNELFLRKT